MLNHCHRYYAPVNIHTPPAANTSPSVKRPNYFDVNRNNILERTYQQTRTYQEPYLRTMNKSPYVIRSNVINGMGYVPYPTTNLQHQNYYPSTEKNEFTDRNVNVKQVWPFEPVGDYCAELLSRDKHYWTEEETGLMLELYEENRNYFTDSRTKKTKLWSMIAGMINKKFGTCVNSEQCSQKYRNMKAEYLKLAESLTPDSEKKFGKHFPQIKRLIDAEERFYEIQENNWLAKPNFQSNQDEKNKAVKSKVQNKTSPSNNNTIMYGHTATENFRGDNELRLPPPTISISPSSTTTVEIVAESIVSRATGLKHNITNSPLNEVTENQPFEMGNIEEYSINMNQSELLVEERELKNSETNAVETLMKLEKQAAENLGNSAVSEDQCSIQELIRGSPAGSNESYTSVMQNKEPNSIISFREEISQIFDEYSHTKNDMLKLYEEKERENIKCMGRCVEIFYKVLKEKINK